MVEKTGIVEAKAQQQPKDNVDHKALESNAGNKLRDEADEQARQQSKERVERARKAEEEARKAREEAEKKAQEAVEALRKADAEHKLEAAQKAQEASQNVADSRRQESAAVKAREAVEVAPAAKNSDKSGLNGVFKSPDGKESYQVVAGELKVKDGKVIGKINENGQLTLAKDGTTISLNSFREGWRFEGSENGQKRSFETSGEMSHGKIFIPGKDGVAVEYEVRMGMVINKATGEQYGSIKPPTEDANGRFAGGSITMGQPPQEIALRDIKNAVFSLKVDGQSGVEGRELRGVSLGPAASGEDKRGNDTGGFLNIGEAIDAERRTQEQYDKKVEANTGFNFSMAYVTGEQEAQRQADSAGEKAASIRITQLEKLAAYGQVDQSILNSFTGAAVEKTNGAAGDKGSNTPGEGKGDEAQTKKIKLPKLDSEQAANSVNGQLRLGTDAYQIKNGHLFRVHHDNNGVSVEDTPSGRLGPGYTALLPGREPIQLANENRVLMEITVGDSNTKHRIVGLGSTRTSEAIGRVEGGLVEVDELLRQANEDKDRALAGDKDYFENRPYLTGGLANWAIGDRDQMLKDFANNIDLQTKALHKELDGLFAGGLDTESFGNNKLDLYVKSTQLLMHSIGTSATTATDLAADGKQMQKLVNDSAVMAATTIATAGVGAALNAAFTAGKIGLVTAIGAEVAADTAIGAGISVVGRMSEKSNALDNAESGAVEGFAMSLGSVGGKVANELKIARSLAMTKAEAGLSLTKTEQLLVASSGKYTGFGLNAAYKIADSAIQTTAFTAAGAIREHDWSGLNAKNLTLGTAWMLAGQGLGHVAGGAGRKVLGIAKEGLGERVLADTVMSYTNAGLGALDQAWDMERQRVAKELGYDSPDKVPPALLYSKISYANILGTMNEAGFSGMVTAPLLSIGAHAVGHGAERMMGIRRTSDGQMTLARRNFDWQVTQQAEKPAAASMREFKIVGGERALTEALARIGENKEAILKVRENLGLRKDILRYLGVHDFGPEQSLLVKRNIGGIGITADRALEVDLIASCDLNTEHLGKAALCSEPTKADRPMYLFAGEDRIRLAKSAEGSRATEITPIHLGDEPKKGHGTALSADHNPSTVLGNDGGDHASKDTTVAVGKEVKLLELARAAGVREHIPNGQIEVFVHGTSTDRLPSLLKGDFASGNYSGQLYVAIDRDLNNLYVDPKRPGYLGIALPREVAERLRVSQPPLLRSTYETFAVGNRNQWIFEPGARAILQNDAFLFDVMTAEQEFAKNPDKYSNVDLADKPSAGAGKQVALAETKPNSDCPVPPSDLQLLSRIKELDPPLEQSQVHKFFDFIQKSRRDSVLKELQLADLRQVFDARQGLSLPGTNDNAIWRGIQLRRDLGDLDLSLNDSILIAERCVGSVLPRKYLALNYQERLTVITLQELSKRKIARLPKDHDISLAKELVRMKPRPTLQQFLQSQGILP